MDLSFILGSIAAILTSVSFLPQAIKTIKTKDTSGISLSMYLIFVTGVAMWLIYGIIIQSLPVILGNVVTIFFSGAILYMKLTDTFKAFRINQLKVSKLKRRYI